MCYACHRPGGLQRGRGGFWDVNIEKDPPGLSGLEMTQSEGRATISKNQSSRLQGERKDRRTKHASAHLLPHKGAHHGKSLQSHTLIHTSQ